VVTFGYHRVVTSRIHLRSASKMAYYFVLMTDSQLSAAASLMGKKGLIARLAKQTPEERRAAALIGNKARWDKHRRLKAEMAAGVGAKEITRPKVAAEGI
jgi:hypothetical protein